MSNADESAAIRAGSKSFAAASKLFDAKTRLDAWRLYAWCRHCDDVIDGQVLGHGAQPVADAGDRLATIRRTTGRALTTDGPVPAPFEALRQVTRRATIPTHLPHALIDGFAMDVEGRTYVRFEDTLVYAYHVAGVVGVMMAMVMGARDRPTLERACDLGIGFQLTNIARDVGEDASNGRLYLPAEWLRAAGVDPAPSAVIHPANRAATAGVVSRLLECAEAYYCSARTGVAKLPIRSAWAIASARDVYREIGREVRRRGPAALTERVSLSSGRKLGLLARGAAVAVATRLPLPPVSRDGLWTMPSNVLSGAQAAP